MSQGYLTFPNIDPVLISIGPDLRPLVWADVSGWLYVCHVAGQSPCG